jgi:hypothetical protein
MDIVEFVKDGVCTKVRHVFDKHGNKSDDKELLFSGSTKHWYGCINGILDNGMVMVISGYNKKHFIFDTIISGGKKIPLIIENLPDDFEEIAKNKYKEVNSKISIENKEKITALSDKLENIMCIEEGLSREATEDLWDIIEELRMKGL